ncbi:MAG TPA: S53 family serine peptidase [Dongiaceae bacterium]|nr:S53 family serine peptidase [Dongiaceae bacterium]
MIRRISTVVLTTVALLWFASGISVAQSQSVMTRHTREEVTSRVAPLVGHLAASQQMELTFVLPHRNQADLDQFLTDLYEPSSPIYRHYLTVEQFTAKYGPSREDYDSLKAWAKQNGFKVLGTSRNRMILRVSGTTQNVESALHVSMGIYQHPTENRTFFAPDREPAPAAPVRLWSIGGLDNFSRPVPMYSKRDESAKSDTVIGDASIGSGPSNSFLGSDMRAAYYTSTGGSLTGAGQSLGIFEFLGTNLKDLTTYYTNVGQTNNVPVTLLSVDGQTVNCTDNSQGNFCDDTEQTLDMTQALGMAPNLSSLVMYIGKGGLSGQTLDDAGILNAMATASPLNAQLSCSWAWKPTDASTDDPFFQQFAAQGQNFFTAAGDSAKWKAGNFVWPADDPFLTSVGGTDLKTASAGGPWSSETAWVDSGGGISTNSFPIPSWQVNAANSCTSCSKTLRNGPDVSANSDFTFYVCADQTACTANLYGGTSFAAPMWAGFLALVNQQAVANGQPTLGFVNPALYNILAGSGYSADFHDITSGSNGFSATAGFDLVTGIGSPNGQPLVDALAPPNVGDFTIAVKPQGERVTRGTVGRAQVSTTVSGGFSSAIALSASGAPTGVQVLFKPSSITGAGTAIMGIRVASSATTGTYTITVTGTGGSKTHSTTFTLVVQ